MSLNRVSTELPGSSGTDELVDFSQLLRSIKHPPHPPLQADLSIVSIGSVTHPLPTSETPETPETSSQKKKRSLVFKNFYDNICVPYYTALQKIFSHTIGKLEDKVYLSLIDFKRGRNSVIVNKYQKELDLAFQKLDELGQDRSKVCPKLGEKWKVGPDTTNADLIRELKKLHSAFEAVKKFGYWEDKMHKYFDKDTFVRDLMRDSPCFLRQYGYPLLRVPMLVTFFKNRKAEAKKKRTLGKLL